MKNQITPKKLTRTAQIIRFHPAGFIESDFTFDERMIARQLMSLGISTSAIHLIKDGEPLEEAVGFSLENENLTIIIGGLGRNVGDVAKKVVAKVTDRKLVLSTLVQKVDRVSLNSSTADNAENLVGSALIPQHAIALEHPEGGTPGFLGEYKQKIFLCLPDDCPHLFPVQLEQGLAWIKERVQSADSLQEVTFRTCGLSEAQIRAKLRDLFTERSNSNRISLSLINHIQGIDVQVRLNCLERTESDFFISLREKVRRQLGADLYAEGMQRMEEVIGSLLRQHHHTLATAESCTGGLISDRLTDVPGSSEYFLRGVVVYSNQAKQELLGVREETLQAFGAVSEQVVREMCSGMKRLSRADLVLAVSGLAGPGGGSAEKPVGLVYIGLYNGRNFQVSQFQFRGSRRQIKLQSSQMALDLVRRYHI